MRSYGTLEDRRCITRAVRLSHEFELLFYETVMETSTVRNVIEIHRLLPHVDPGLAFSGNRHHSACAVSLSMLLQCITHHALVIGGSMAGLLAACVLSEHFERVTIIERDQLIDDRAV